MSPTPIPGFSLPDALLFVSAVDEGSFRAAADRHGITASGVSKAVARLERTLGVKLLVRSTRRLRLTDEGQLFHERSREALALMHDAAELASDTSRSMKGTLRLGLPTEIGSELVIPLLREFLPLHPELHVELVPMMRVGEFYEHRVDCAVVMGDVNDATLAGRRLGASALATVAAPGYLARRCPPASPEELARFDCITLLDEHGHPEPWRFRAERDDAIVETRVDGRLRVHRLAQAISAATAGIGVAQIPSVLVRAQLDDGRLVRLLAEREVPGVAAWVVYPARRAMPRRVKAAIDFLERAAEGARVR